MNSRYTSMGEELKSKAQNYIKGCLLAICIDKFEKEHPNIVECAQRGMGDTKWTTMLNDHTWKGEKFRRYTLLDRDYVKERIAEVIYPLLLVTEGDQLIKIQFGVRQNDLMILILDPKSEDLSEIIDALASKLIECNQKWDSFMSGPGVIRCIVKNEKLQPQLIRTVFTA